MYNKVMKKTSVLIILALLTGLAAPCEAGIFNAHKARIEQNKIQHNAEAQIKAMFYEQLKQADKHNIDGIKSTYSPDFISSDGFNFDTYMKLVEDTWETYPDISYNSVINKIEVNDNYATVFVTETAVANPKEEIGGFDVLGELYSVSRCIYYLEKHGSVWLIHSEQVIDETSTLKFGKARFVDIKLNAPKQVGAGKYYSASLNVDAPEKTAIFATIGKENIVYPQKRADDAFRKLSSDNRLERVFLSNKNNANEYIAASVGITETENFDENKIKVYMSGLAFIMTRVNVVNINPQNKGEANGKNK